MEQRSRTRQLPPASFHPRRFRTYNGEISLVFCTITCEGSAAPTVTASPLRLFLFSSELTLILFPFRKRTNPNALGRISNVAKAIVSIMGGDIFVFRAPFRLEEKF